MRTNALVACRKRRRVHKTDSGEGESIAANKLARSFRATASNSVWMAHIAYLPTSRLAVFGGSA